MKLVNLDALAQQIKAGQPIRSLRMVDDHFPDMDGQGALFIACELEQVQSSNLEVRINASYIGG